MSEMRIEPMLKTWRGIRLIFGGAASGKSEYAEGLALKGPNVRIYLATMRRSAAAEERIRKHVEQRRGRGFITMEDPELDIPSWDGVAAGVILLEDLPNLLANRMFGPGGDIPTEDVGAGEDVPPRDAGAGVDVSTENAGAGEDMHRREILRKLKTDLLELSRHAEQLIIVSGDIFEDGAVYDDTTEGYLDSLGELHRWLAERADRVTEVVCGIPIDH